MKNIYDVLVLGSGVGALFAALTASRAGRRVLVLEAGKQFGGYLNPFRRGKFSFEPGLHYIGECGPGQTFSRLIERLELGVSFREISPDGIDRIRFPGYEVLMPKGVERYRDRLAADFPNEKPGLDRFFGLVAEFRRATSALNKLNQGGRVRLGNLIELIKHSPFLARYGAAKLQDVLNELFRDPILKGVLSAQSGDYALPPSRAPALLGFGLLDHYLNGAYFPVGGSRALRDALVDAIEQYGGELKKNARVVRILVEGRRVAGVLTENGDEFLGKTIISNIDAIVTYRDLIGEPFLSGLMKRRIRGTTHSPSSFCLFIGTDMDIARAGMSDANIWNFPDADLERCYAPLFRGEIPDERFFFLSSLSLKDPGSPDHAPPGHQTLEFVTLMPYAPFSQWEGTKSMKRGVPYEALKESLTQKYLAQAETILPGLKDHIKILEAATPLTNVHFANAPKGSIYGPEHTPMQMGPLRFSPKGELEGLFLCGSSVFSAGIVACATSGHTAAKMALRALSPA